MSNKRRDLEQERQEFGHRDLVGGARMDGLANGPNRLGEILDAMNVGDIAGLKVHFGNAEIIAPDKAKQDLGKEAALLTARAGP